MLGVNVVAADTDDEARFLASSGRQSFASLRAGRPIPLPPPSAEWARDPAEPEDPLQRTRVSFVGSPETVAPQMREFVARTGADELIVAAHIYDHAARLRSYIARPPAYESSQRRRPSGLPGGRDSGGSEDPPYDHRPTVASKCPAAFIMPAPPS